MRLEARGIGYYYKKNNWLFRDLNLALHRDEVVGLVAPSGFGKTTLAKLIAGFEEPKEGQVTLDAMPLPKEGFCPVQLVYQHPEKAVNNKWRMKHILEEAVPYDPRVLDAFGIQEQWLDRFPNELSGGELQRFSVARALSGDTKFLIADEMTTMLDAITQAQIWQGVLEIREKRKIGILVISHEPALIKRLCSRVYRL